MNVDADGVGHERGRLGGRAAVAVGGALAVPKDGCDYAGLHVDLANAVVGVVADVQVACGVEGEVLGVVEARGLLRAAVPAVPAEAKARPKVRLAVADLRRVVSGLMSREEVDDAGLRVDAADVVGPLAGYEDVAVLGDRDTTVCVHLGLGGGAAVAATPLFARPDDGLDDARLGVDAAIDEVADVVDDDVAVLVLGDVVRRAELSVDGRATVAGVAGHARSGEAVEDAVVVDAPDDVHVVVVDEELAGLVPAQDAERPSGVGLLCGDTLADSDARDGGHFAGLQVVEEFVEVHAFLRSPPSSVPPPAGEGWAVLVILPTSTVGKLVLKVTCS